MNTKLYNLLRKRKRGVRLYKRSIKARAKQQLEQFKSYLKISLICAGILFILLFLFTSVLRIHYLISFLISFAIAGSFNFFLNRYRTFRGFNPIKLTKLYYKFFVVSSSSFLLNILFLFLLVNFFNIWYLLAQFYIALIGLPIMYFVHKKWTFDFF